MNLGAARLLLDPATMAARLRRHPLLAARDPHQVMFDALWIKPGRHFNVCYRLTYDDVPRLLRCAVFALDPARARRLAAETGRCGHRQPDAACAACATFVVESGVLVQVFPHDHRLPTLARCLDAARLDPVLVSAPCRRCAPVGYRPGMRCQIRYELADGTVVFGKVVVEGEPARAAARHARIFAVVNARPRGFAIARPLGYSTEARLSLVAAAAGRSLYAAVRAGEDLRAAMPCVARAVSEFHGVDMADVERAYGPSDELHLLEGWVALVADLYPALAGDLERGLEGLRATQPAPAPPRAFVHRDFYDKQVLLHGAAVTLLDMDTACAGDPEIDFGNFAAHLRLRGLQWGRAPACRDLEVEFLAACPGSIDPVRLDWYRRATLLRLACGYAVRPHWHHLAPALRAEMERP